MRLALVQKHRTPGDEEMIAKSFVAGAKEFLRSGAKDMYDALVEQLPVMLSDDEARLGCIQAIAREQVAAKAELLEKVEKGERLYWLPKQLALLHSLGAMSTAEVSDALVMGTETKLHECRSDARDRARALDEARAAAIAVGLDWNAIFPAEKRVCVGGKDIAAIMRGLNHENLDTPQFTQFLEAFLQALPPRTTEEKKSRSCSRGS